MSHIKLFFVAFTIVATVGIIYLINHLDDLKKLEKTDEENNCMLNQDDDDLFYKMKSISVLKRKSVELNSKITVEAIQAINTSQKSTNSAIS